ncbi:MAG: hypothetical protein HPY76_14515, partial [Anaerolineae bacterium]|nr:hypothetical protein [Anaerolineae bacterium]
VLCRNVLIYFDPPTRARVVSQLLDHVAPDGLLFVGHAENLAGDIANAESGRYFIGCYPQKAMEAESMWGRFVAWKEGK